MRSEKFILILAMGFLLSLAVLALTGCATIHWDREGRAWAVYCYDGANGDFDCIGKNL